MISQKSLEFNLCTEKANTGLWTDLKAGFHFGKLSSGQKRPGKFPAFVLEPLVPTESSQDKGNFSVRSRPEENDPEWKPAFSHGRSENGDTCR